MKNQIITQSLLLKFGMTGMLMLFAGIVIFAQMSDKQPNILLIISDDIRTELNCYGTSYIKSPNIDRLAQRGTLFTRAYVQQAVCSASRASFLTGVRPDVAGADYPYSEYFVNTFWPAHPTIAEYFERQDYEVRTFGKIHHGQVSDKIKHPNYVVKGMEKYALKENTQKNRSKGRRKQTPPFEAADVPDEGYEDGVLAREGVKAIKELSGKKSPFFIAVGFRKPHLPFCAPKKYWDLYAEKDINLALNPTLPQGAPDYAISPNTFRNFKLPDDVIDKSYDEFPEYYQRKLKHGYAACVSYVDAQVGLLMDQLNKSGELENTIVVFISDHGWHLGEQGTWGKQTNFENGTLSPLIISVPKTAQGIKANQLVEYVDIYPTLVELAGFEPADYFEGTSFVPVLNNPDMAWKKAAFSQFPRYKKFEGYTIRTADFRYVEWRTWDDDSLMSIELYDHRSDPLESINVAEDKKYKDVVEKLSKQLHAGWKAALPEGVVNNSNNRLAPTPPIPWKGH